MSTSVKCHLFSLPTKNFLYSTRHYKKFYKQQSLRGAYFFCAADLKFGA